ncbi:uncharacterized protein LOC125525980 [Triticum urartu]|uniref:uncharacterized protein LOC119334224 n=1 Tax=Triticum dicoccoides TaxID=85692 RepID=UPI001891C505|nr:uncharacterized protein LOC119334224 [Triticum dicoccoides]XP_048546945.1 uncharacterized protein LOC125525980 [Triticum urartu]
MDKVLAISMPSMSSVDIAPGAGSSGSRARLCWRGSKLQEDEQTGSAGKQGKQGGLLVEEEQQPGKGKSQSPLPRFVPEFDGIDCFETIVCH